MQDTYFKISISQHTLDLTASRLDYCSKDLLMMQLDGRSPIPVILVSS